MSQHFFYARGSDVSARANEFQEFPGLLFVEFAHGPHGFDSEALIEKPKIEGNEEDSTKDDITAVDLLPAFLLDVTDQETAAEVFPFSGLAVSAGGG